MKHTENFKQAFKLIENTSQFKNIDESISVIFYTLYGRSKKLFYAMDVLRRVNVPEISHLEILPLLRVYIESYFHLCYVVHEEDKEKVKEGYKYLAYYSQYSTADKMKESQTLGDLGKSFVEEYGEKKNIPKKYKFLNSPKSLANKIGKIELWEKHYNTLNSSLHFNPGVYHNYGDYKDGKFVFDEKNEQFYLLEEAVYRTLEQLTWLIIGEIVLFLDNNELEGEIEEMINGYCLENTEV
ncbi:DUF5677 domain-containing protein [Lysinibacillus xylanilyticus]|uniref:DUF5677 domain-containing protein n=1 Tax=Lysinibacillus xylanilyticus TaxID=582475 RepID=UPI003D02C123